MTRDPDDPKTWRDFRHTMSVMLASALAEYERTREHREARLVPRFRVTLLAAAATGELSLVRSKFTVEGGGLAVSTEERDGEIAVTVQLMGFASLAELGGREARIKSDDGAIDYGFRFSDQGTAVCTLADTPEVRAGIKQGLVLYEVVD